VWQEALAGIGADETRREQAETWRARTEALVAADRQRRLDQRALRAEFARRRSAAKTHAQATRLAALDRQTQADSTPASRSPRPPATRESGGASERRS